MSPPAVATWLLKKFRPADEALLGDLLEECPNGRSTAWYWRQVVGDDSGRPAERHPGSSNPCAAGYCNGLDRLAADFFTLG